MGRYFCDHLWPLRTAFCQAGFSRIPGIFAEQGVGVDFFPEYPLRKARAKAQAGGWSRRERACEREGEREGEREAGAKFAGRSIIRDECQCFVVVDASPSTTSTTSTCRSARFRSVFEIACGASSAALGPTREIRTISATHPASELASQQLGAAASQKDAFEAAAGAFEKEKGSTAGMCLESVSFPLVLQCFRAFSF